MPEAYMTVEFSLSDALGKGIERYRTAECSSSFALNNADEGGEVVLVSESGGEEVEGAKADTRYSLVEVHEVNTVIMIKILVVRVRIFIVSELPPESARIDSARWV